MGSLPSPTAVVKVSLRQGQMAKYAALSLDVSELFGHLPVPNPVGVDPANVAARLVAAPREAPAADHPIAGWEHLLVLEPGILGGGEEVLPVLPHGGMAGVPL